MASSPLVSIVTICFENPAELATTLASFGGLDFSIVETVIVDGSRSDACERVARAHAAVVSRYRREGDRGKFDAMNKGVRRSAGKAVIFMNSGDAFCDAAAFCSAVRAHADRLESHILYGDYIMRTNGLSAHCRAPQPDRDNIRKGMFTSHQSIVLPRQWHLAHRYDASMSIEADAKLLRTAFAELPSIRLPLAIGFCALGGVSNMPGSWAEVVRHYRECVAARNLNRRERFVLLIRLVARKLYCIAFGKAALSRLQVKRAGRRAQSFLAAAPISERVGAR